MDDSRFNISEDGLTLTVVEAREHANITCRGVNTIGATNYTSRLHVAAGEWGAGESGAAQWTKPGHFETSKIHFPTSEGVSVVSKRAN